MKCYACEASTGLPFKCKFCNHHFCDDHRLPEDHDCPGLKVYKAERLSKLRKGKETSIVYSPSETKKPKRRVKEWFEPLVWRVERNPDLYIGLFLLFVLMLMFLLL
jgi:hypothetical protein